MVHLLGASALFLSSSICALAGHTSVTESSLRGANTLKTDALVQTRAKTRKLMSRDPELLEEYVNHNKAVSAAVDSIPSQTMASLMQSINGKAFGDELHSLCDVDKSRFVGTAGNDHMVDRIRKKFADMGLQPHIEDLDVVAPVKKYIKVASAGDKPAGYGGNVIGVLKGTDLAHETVIIGAHYDSVNWENTGAAAPGVDDNGSGSALVQLVARALMKANVKPRRTVMFVGFNAEEEGLVGSDQMAIKAAKGDYGDIKAVLIADEVAYPGEGYPGGGEDGKAIFETVGTVPGSEMLMDTFAHHAALEKPHIRGFQVNTHGFGSDHMSFLSRKIPALLLIERNNMAHADKWGHSGRDDYSHVNMDYGAAMTRLMLRVAHALAFPADSSASAGGLVAASPHLVSMS